MLLLDDHLLKAVTIVAVSTDFDFVAVSAAAVVVNYFASAAAVADYFVIDLNSMHMIKR